VGFCIFIIVMKTFHFMYVTLLLTYCVDIETAYSYKLHDYTGAYVTTI
jgi:hypothetical protein